MKKVLMWKMEETKVIYHIDDEDTPYLVKLPKSPTDVTLSDFKNVLNRPSYKFFFKSMDDDFGWVCNRMSVMLTLFLGTVCVVFCRFTVIFQLEHFCLKKRCLFAQLTLKSAFLRKTPHEESPWQCFVFSSGPRYLCGQIMFSLEICLTTLLECIVYWNLLLTFGRSVNPKRPTENFTWQI